MNNKKQPETGQPPTTPAPPKWSGRTRGGYWGNWIFIQLVRLVGLWPAYALLVFVAAYYALASRRQYRISIDYLQRVLGPQPFWKRPFLTYAHFFSSGITLLDRLAVIIGRSRMRCAYDGEPMLREYLDRGQGIILVGAHVGAWEMGGHLLGRLGTPVNLVVLETEAARVRDLFAEALQDKQFRLLTTDDNPLRVVPIIAALRRGEIVALHGDRALGNQVLSVPFLGGQARFPFGPYLLAAASGAPIFQVFAVRERLGQYRFLSFPPRSLPRTLLRAPPEALREIVTEYADRLASVLRQYPFQWYNFFPFWE